MKILSLFDGISGAMQALKNLNIDVGQRYYASEIDKYALAVSRNNHNKIFHLGDVTRIIEAKLLCFKKMNIDLLIGGSPCQDLSVAKRSRKHLEGSKSKLFYEYVKILDYIQPKNFILENVSSMSSESKSIISKELGVAPVLINSKYFTGQHRNRLYFCNFKVDDIKANSIDWNKHLISKKQAVKLAHTEKGIKYLLRKTSKDRTHLDFGFNHCTNERNAKCLIANLYKGVPYNVVLDYRFDPVLIRKLHPIECERLQGFPDDYTKGISNTQRYKCLGNSFTVPVIEYLIKSMLKTC